MASFPEFVDLASSRIGGAVLYASNESQGSKEHLLRETEPTLNNEPDGWLTHRRRAEGSEYCIVRLAAGGVVRRVVLDTTTFAGNFPESCSIEGVSLPGYPEVETLLAESTPWHTVLPRTRLEGNKKHSFAIEHAHHVTHLRLRIHPDGGVARLRVLGEILPEPRVLARPEVELSSVELGAHILACSDDSVGAVERLLFPDRPLGAEDGWQTRRSRSSEGEWCVLQLAARGTIHRIEIDTTHDRGNAPESCSVEGCFAPDASKEQLAEGSSVVWKPLLAKTKLLRHTRHVFEEVQAAGEITHARLRCFPDGAIARLKLFGTVTSTARQTAGVKRFNALALTQATAAMRSCCGASRWIEQMLEERPFVSFEAMLERATTIWNALGPDDWHEAFRAHPRIGERKAAVDTGKQAHSWSAGEQSGVATAQQTTMEALAQANRDYEARFGHIYIVCATGKSAEEMLAIAQRRLHNDAETELRVAAEEQRKITEIRLRKLAEQTR